MSEDFSYSSQKVLTDMNSKEERIRSKLFEKQFEFDEWINTDIDNSVLNDWVDSDLDSNKFK